MAVKIAIDCGHGLYTAGKQTPDGIKEWTLNDKVRDKVVAFLAPYDCEIIHTDNDEGKTDESLSSRVSRYIAAGVAAVVSIHHNAFTGKWNNATGVEVYTDNNPTAGDTKLANSVYSRLVKYTGLKGRGIKKAAFTVINQNKIPAILIEGGFMDGSTDYKVITSEAGQTAYAKAVAEGLIEFLNLKKKSVSPVVEIGVVTGFNIPRNTNYLVIYAGGKTTGTNEWGSEVAIDKNGIASAPVYGVGNMAIPSGGFVLSGHGTNSDWISRNIKKGKKVKIRASVE